MEKSNLSFNKYPFLKELGLNEINEGCYRNGEWKSSGNETVTYSPHTGEPLATIKLASKEDYEECIQAMEKEKVRWMTTPAPIRGDIVR